MIKPKDILLVVLAPLSLMLAIIVFWSSNKGFEYTDESFYILTLMQPEQSPDLFYYQHIFNFLFGWMDPGLVGYRLIRLLLTIIVSWVLSNALVQLFGSNSEQVGNSLQKRSVWFFVTFIGLAISYSIYPQCPSYNSLSVLWLALLVALMIKHTASLGYNKAIVKSRRNLGYMGLMVCLIFFTRFTTGILSFLLVLTWILIPLIRKEIELKDFIRNMIDFSLGIGLTVLLFSVFIKSIFGWIFDFSSALEQVEGHGIGELLSKYLDSFNFIFNDFLQHFILYPILLFLWTNIKDVVIKDGKFSWLKVIITLSIIALAIRVMFVNNLFLSGVQHLDRALQFYLLSLSLVVTSLLNKEFLSLLKVELKLNRNVLPLLLLLLLVPIIGSLGTDNSLHIQMLQFCFAFVILGVMLLFFFRKHLHSSVLISLVLIITIGSTSQVYSGLVLSPYRIQGTLFDQRSNLNLPNGDMLLVNSSTKMAVDGYLNLLGSSAYQIGDPMMVLDGMPGFIYLANAKVTGSSWNKNHQPKNICYNLSRSDTLSIRNTVLLSAPNHVIENRTIECLKEAGISFPSNYQNIGNANNPVFGMNLAILIPLKRN